MATSENFVPNDQLKAMITAYLTEHGPTGKNVMIAALKTPYDRTLAVLKSMQTDGVVETTEGRLHKGVTLVAWCMVGDKRSRQKNAGQQFNAAQTLKAMQAACRRSLGASA